MKKILLGLLKISISAGLIAYLVWNATHGEEGGKAFATLRDQPKDWWLLLAAWAVSTLAVLMTFVRWWYLVRALEIPCRFRDALRIGFWGYLFNLAPLGIVGGDLVKAVMLAHEHKNFRTKAVASVLVDRLLGLYFLFVLSAAAIFLTGFWRIPGKNIALICWCTYALTALGTVGIGLMFLPGITEGRLARALGRLPRIGSIVENLIDAVRMYRKRPGVLLLASLLSLILQGLFVVGLYLIARGLPGNVPTLAMHFVLVPLSSIAGVLPLPLGPFEGVLDYLYTKVPPPGAIVYKGQGLVVALAYRIITLLIAALGIYYYFGYRREVKEAIHEEDHGLRIGAKE
ncbi:MAG: flippase-like domain-containing protein [Pirellulales bacterium]|nr:flippase-like domain-containing protein [Pirellulales bacterium]